MNFKIISLRFYAAEMSLFISFKTEISTTQKHMRNKLKYLDYKLYYQQLHLKYLCNLARYWLQAPWGWNNSVEIFRSVIICEIIVHFLSEQKIKKKITACLNIQNPLNLPRCAFMGVRFWQKTASVFLRNWMRQKKSRRSVILKQLKLQFCY